MEPDELEQRVRTICLLLLAAVAGGAALRWLRPAMVPFVLALFIALGLNPIIDLVVRALRLPRGLAIVVVGLGSVLVFTGLAGVLYSSIGQLAENANEYQDQIVLLVNRIASGLPLERMGIDLSTQLDAIRNIPARTIAGVFLGTTNAIFETLSQSFLVLIFLIYLLLGSQAPTTGVWQQINTRVARYLVTKAVTSAATGILVGSVLAMLGVDLALAFGLCAFLLNFIPSVGSAIATLLPLPVVLFSPELGSGAAILAIAIPGAIQFAVGNLIEPKLMGDSLDLHPIAILLALILWGMLWGIVGMLLATPITAVMKILFERLELTRPLAHLLGGRLTTA